MDRPSGSIRVDILLIRRGRERPDGRRGSGRADRTDGGEIVFGEGFGGGVFGRVGRLQEGVTAFSDVANGFGFGEVRLLCAVAEVFYITYSTPISPIPQSA